MMTGVTAQCGFPSRRSLRDLWRFASHPRTGKCPGRLKFDHRNLQLERWHGTRCRCVEKVRATFPGGAMSSAKVALSPKAGFIMRRQFGPSGRIVPRRSSACICCSSFAPSRPPFLEARRNHDRRAHPRVHAFPRMTAGTVCAGVTTTAKSIFSGTSARVMRKPPELRNDSG